MTSETVTVSIPSKIDRACALETSRYSINGVRVTPAKSTGRAWLTATDGRMLAAVPAMTDKPLGHGCIIPTRAAKAAKSVALNGRVEAHKGAGKTVRVEVYEYHEPCSFPPAADILTDASADTTWITFNPNMLADLAHAIGAGRVVTIGIRAANKPIMVLGHNHDDPESSGIGMLMPCNAYYDEPVAYWNRETKRFREDEYHARKKS